MRNLNLFRNNNDFFPTVRTWRPLLQEIDELFNNVATPAQQNVGNYSINHEVDETTDHYVLSFDVPGIAKENIEIQAIGNQISVKGERKNSFKDANGAKEGQSTRSFERTITLPSDLKADEIEAHYENGVLRLFVPKAEEAKPRKIAIGDSKEGFFKRLANNTKEGPH